MGGHSAWKKRVKNGELAKQGGGAICRHRPRLGRRGKDIEKNKKGNILGGPNKKKKKRLVHPDSRQTTNSDDSLLFVPQENNEVSIENCNTNKNLDSGKSRGMYILITIIVFISFLGINRLITKNNEQGNHNY